MAQYDLSLNTPLLLPRALTRRDQCVFLYVGYFVKTNLQSDELVRQFPRVRITSLAWPGLTGGKITTVSTGDQR